MKKVASSTVIEDVYYYYVPKYKGQYFCSYYYGGHGGGTSYYWSDNLKHAVTSENRCSPTDLHYDHFEGLDEAEMVKVREIRNYCIVKEENEDSI